MRRECVFSSSTVWEWNSAVLHEIDLIICNKLIIILKLAEHFACVI